MQILWKEKNPSILVNNNQEIKPFLLTLEDTTGKQIQSGRASAPQVQMLSSIRATAGSAISDHEPPYFQGQSMTKVFIHKHHARHLHMDHIHGKCHIFHPHLLHIVGQKLGRSFALDFCWLLLRWHFCVASITSLVSLFFFLFFIGQNVNLKGGVIMYEKLFASPWQNVTKSFVVVVSFLL